MILISSKDASLGNVPRPFAVYSSMSLLVLKTQMGALTLSKQVLMQTLKTQMKHNAAFHQSPNCKRYSTKEYNMFRKL